MREKSKWLFEYSKKVVRCMVILYIAHIVFSDITMIALGDLSNLGQVTDDVTKVEIVCLGGYLFKATFENVFKIKTKSPMEGYLENYEDTVG